MNRHSSFRLFLAVFLLSWSWGQAGAHQANYTTSLVGPQLQVANKIIAEDYWYSYMQANTDWYDYTAGPLDYSKRFTNLNSIGRVVLEYEGTAGNMYTSPWTLTLAYHVKSLAADGTLIEEADEELVLQYDPAFNAPIIDKALREYPGAHRLEIEITSISGQPNGQFLANDFSLDGVIEVERYFILQANSTALTHALIHDADGDGLNAEIQYLWSFVEGAEEYELQYVHVSDQLLYGQTPNEVLDFDLATRIITPFQDFRLIPAYEKGSLFYRVRPIGRFGTDLEQRQLGPWSTVQEIVIGTAQGPGVDLLAYEPDHNWLHAVSHAENGKHSETANFVDGSGNTRQTVVKDPSTDLVLVQESMMDYEGRPAVNIIPTPFLPSGINANTLDMGADLKFYDDFSLAQGSNTQFNKVHFDLDINRQNPEGLAANQSEVAGAYYSSANPLSNWGPHRYLADGVAANGAAYTYTRTIYDDHGRLKEQSGLGPQYRIGQGHTTRYFYGNAGQTKLDRLFGTEIGYAPRYRKSMVQDANGQLSVSYENLSGQVVATALVGKVPLNPATNLPLVSELSTEGGMLGTVTEDLGLHNAYNATQEEWAIVYSHLAACVGPHDFRYRLDLSNTEFTDLACPGLPYNENCQFELFLEVLDVGGQAMDFSFSTSVPVIDVHGNSVSTVNQGSFPIVIEQQEDYDFQFSILFPEIGTYTIIKRLQPYGLESILEAYREFVSDPANNCIDLETIVAECDEIMVTTEYPDFEQDCAALLEVFKADMSPGGQYFDNLKKDATDPNTINDWLLGFFPGSPNHDPNVLAPGLGLVEVASFDDLENILADEGYTVSISTIEEGWNTFREYWFLESVQEHLLTASIGNWGLQRFHPEYSHYQWCLDQQALAPMNRSFEQEEMEYADALANNWLPALTQGTCPNGTGNFNLVNDDPYFTNAMGDRPYQAGTDPENTGAFLMRDLICEYPEAPTAGNSMWEAATEAAAEYHSTTSPTDEQIWEIFADYYRQQKQRVITLQKKNPCSNTHYSPYLFDEVDGEPPFPDMVADLPRENTFNLWGSTSYNVGSGPTPDMGIADPFDGWNDGCTFTLNHAVTPIETLMAEWVDGNANANFNYWLQIMDERAEGFFIRVPDLVQTTQDVLEETPNNNTVFDTNDNWEDWEVPVLNPCQFGAAALIPYAPIQFPVDGPTLANAFAKTMYAGDDTGLCFALADQVELDLCEALVPNVDYYSYADFVEQNPAFIECLEAEFEAYVSSPWDVIAEYTNSHLVLRSPSHYDIIPEGALFSPFSNCCFNGGGATSEPSLSLGTDATRSRATTNYRRSARSELEIFVECDVFSNPCDQIIPHCLCEDLEAAENLAVIENTDVISLYELQYGATALDWVNYLTLLESQCSIIYDPGASDDAVIAAVDLIEDLADGTINNQDHVDYQGQESPVALECFIVEPPCETESVAIADYYNEEAYAEAVDALVEQFRANYLTYCMNPLEAPDDLWMTYEDREYHFTLYYYTPDGQLHATVPPEGVQPISDIDPTIFTQIRNSRDLAWSGTVTVPAHRRNDQRDDQLMTLYKYDSFDNLVSNQVPDHTTTTTSNQDQLADYGETFMLYDDLGRIRFSQDPEQKSDSEVSYLKYDALGRIVESGTLFGFSNFSLLESQVNNADFPQPALYALSERLLTYYDEVTGFSPGSQDNLRQRVVKTEYYETETNLSHATHYSYDVRGNVKTLWQEDRSIVGNAGFIKRIDYDFGVVDGLVYRVDYQKGQADAYSHEYCYDANNRLLATLTSEGGGIWDQDQRNFYRLDGLLHRMELGAYKVQGMDYAYTLQGWIKGVNASSLNVDRDMGNDGASTTLDTYNQLHRWVGQDAYGYTLHYNPLDYTSIQNFSLSNYFETYIPTVNGINYNAFDGQPVSGLYNGNITAMQTALSGENGQHMDHLLKGYFYDQLMRLKYAQSAISPGDAGFVYDNNQWDDDSDATDEYFVELDYDHNGNILQLNRNGRTVLGMDQLQYDYTSNSVGLVFNRLNYVNDQVPAGNYPDDFESQSTGNYSYDHIGNLIADASEEIADIEWNNQGKVKRLTRVATSQKPDLEYRYDSQGNRIEKIVKVKDSGGNILPQELWTSTLYVRDAQGNVLATYDKNYGRPTIDGNGVGVIPDLLQYQEDVYVIREGSGIAPPTDPSGVPELVILEGLIPPGGAEDAFVELLTWNEAHIYGSSRLGIERKNQLVSLQQFTANIDPSTLDFYNVANVDGFTITEIDASIQRQVGTKYYELSNHLSNVLEVISDKAIPVSADGQTVDYYEADVVSANDYYPFGLEMPGRKFSGSEAYRYGFNGKENDRDWGNQLIQDYGFRLYNPSIAKFLSVDPLAKSFAWNAPYNFAENQPIWAIDKDGGLRIIIHHHYKNADGTITTVKTEREVVLYEELIGVSRSPVVVDRYYEETDINPSPQIYEGTYKLVDTKIREGSGETFGEGAKRTNPVAYYSMKFVFSPFNVTQVDKLTIAAGLIERDPFNNRILSKGDRVLQGSFAVIGYATLFFPAKLAHNGKIGQAAISLIIAKTGLTLLGENIQHILTEKVVESIARYAIENGYLDFDDLETAKHFIVIDPSALNNLMEQVGSEDELRLKLLTNPDEIIFKTKDQAVESVLQDDAEGN